MKVVNMNITPIDIGGQYLVIGNKLQSSGKPPIYIRKRKVKGQGKTDQFLAIHKPTFQYISGLYPVKGAHNTFTLDCGNKPYKLVIGNTKAIIAEVSNGGY
jgi:hypothetical protein